MGGSPLNQFFLTARGTSQIGCHSCHLLCRVRTPQKNKNLICPRCGSTLHQRKPNSLRRTWALVLAASIFYIPANLLPITIVISFGKAQADTIMSGVIYFIGSGMWPIALVIFVASILVPILKLTILTFLLVTVQRRSTWRLKDRTRLFRITEAIGRWSMVDIFVVTILVALVNLGSVATIKAGPGAAFFAAVVVITMFASLSFDPRLIWDAKETT
jgi:paraquat-inducible protein A